MIKIMKKAQSNVVQEKSTILLLVFLFILLNAALLFRSSINALYFAEEMSPEYASVQATVNALTPDTTVQNGENTRLIPTFSFVYRGKEILTDAPDLAFDVGTDKGETFKKGGEYTLWMHKKSGVFQLPPVMGQKEIGRSQLLLSGVFLLMAVAVWVLRNRMAIKVQR